MAICPTYCILLRKSEERRRHVMNHSVKALPELVIVDAVDGDSLETVRTAVNDAGLPRTPFCRSKYEWRYLACRLSHMRAWQAMLDSGDRFAAFLEDDAFVVNDFDEEPIGAYLNRVGEELMYGSSGVAAIAYLYADPCFGPPDTTDDEFDTISRSRGTWPFVGYIVNAAGAAHLLKAARQTSRLGRQVDLLAIDECVAGKLISFRTKTQRVRNAGQPIEGSSLGMKSNIYGDRSD